jgi:transcriptional regulator with XRE-family HTH domain
MDHETKNFEAGNTLRRDRLAKGYSLEDLAITTGLTTAEIDAVERGANVTANNVERIEHALR